MRIDLELDHDGEERNKETNRRKNGNNEDLLRRNAILLSPVIDVHRSDMPCVQRILSWVNGRKKSFERQNQRTTSNIFTKEEAMPCFRDVLKTK